MMGAGMMLLTYIGLGLFLWAAVWWIVEIARDWQDDDDWPEPDAR